MFVAHCVLVQRRLKVKVRAQDVEGKEQILSLTGWQARIFQHEYDHLQVRHHRSLPLLGAACQVYLRAIQHIGARKSVPLYIEYALLQTLSCWL